jgi:hypothetical protein
MVGESATPDRMDTLDRAVDIPDRYVLKELEDLDVDMEFIFRPNVDGVV